MSTMCLSCKESEKCGPMKYVIVMSPKKGHHQMKNLRVKCIETIMIQELLIFKIFKCHDFCHFLISFSISH